MPCCSSVGINTFGAALGCVYVCCGGWGGGGERYWVGGGS